MVIFNRSHMLPDDGCHSINYYPTDDRRVVYDRPLIRKTEGCPAIMRVQPQGYLSSITVRTEFLRILFLFSAL
jgi:hypothetical protein